MSSNGAISLQLPKFIVRDNKNHKFRFSNAQDIREEIVNDDIIVTKNGEYRWRIGKQNYLRMFLPLQNFTVVFLFKSADEEKLYCVDGDKHSAPPVEVKFPKCLLDIMFKNETFATIFKANVKEWIDFEALSSRLKHYVAIESDKDVTGSEKTNEDDEATPIQTTRAELYCYKILSYINRQYLEAEENNVPLTGIQIFMARFLVQTLPAWEHVFECANMSEFQLMTMILCFAFLIDSVENDDDDRIPEDEYDIAGYHTFLDKWCNELLTRYKVNGDHLY